MTDYYSPPCATLHFNCYRVYYIFYVFCFGFMHSILASTYPMAKLVASTVQSATIFNGYQRMPSHLHSNNTSQPQQDMEIREKQSGHEPDHKTILETVVELLTQ
eukprot:529225_1